jgi:hypothetical protein
MLASPQVTTRYRGTPPSSISFHPRVAFMERGILHIVVNQT